MKTAISVPDPLFKAAERAARRQKMSRSRFYCKALATYLRASQDEEIRKALDEVYAAENSDLDPALAAAAYHILSEEKW